MKLDCAWVYILTNERVTTFYVGVTTDLSTRLWEQNEAESKVIYSEV